MIPSRTIAAILLGVIGFAISTDLWVLVHRIVPYAQPLRMTTFDDVGYVFLAKLGWAGIASAPVLLPGLLRRLMPSQPPDLSRVVWIVIGVYLCSLAGSAAMLFLLPTDFFQPIRRVHFVMAGAGFQWVFYPTLLAILGFLGIQSLQGKQAGNKGEEGRNA